MKGTAIVFSNGIFDSRSAKTTHGLIRGSERFEILGVIDHVFHGQDAGTLLDGQHRDTPIYKDVAEFLSSGKKADYAVIGVAPAGGQLPADMRQDVLTALTNGIGLGSGLFAPLARAPWGPPPPPPSSSPPPPPPPFLLPPSHTPPPPPPSPPPLLQYSPL